MKVKIIILMVTILVISCKTSDVNNECVAGYLDSVILRWGGYNSKTNYISGWQIDGNYDLYEILRTESDKDYKLKKIGKVDAQRFCRMVKLTEKNFVKIQALNAPGDSSHFIQYINNKTNTNLRALWNVRFKTYGSTEFRNLFDSLKLFVK